MSTQKRRYELKARAESQQATRARIAAAAAALHEEVGVARTTVADIARRAGVQRLTVYNHFPDLEALLPACSAHWLAEHPLPDLEPAFALEDPAERLLAVLDLALRLVPRERADAAARARRAGDRPGARRVDGAVERRGARRARRRASPPASSSRGARALVALALDFWTWQRLDREGSTTTRRPTLMTGVVRDAARLAVLRKRSSRLP